MTTILFKDLVENNSTEIKSYMNWKNYDLNDVVLPVVEELKDHALLVLSKSYGMFHVEHDILDELCADVFIEFPILMQQLSITRLMNAATVKEFDEGSETVTRIETLVGEVDQTSELTVGTTNTENNTINTQQTTTGTVQVEGSDTTEQDSTTTINNTSGVAATGGKSVNLTHSMPEQSLPGGTGNFPADAQGTPILTTSYVGSAAQSFSTSNPISTTETSSQTLGNDSTTVSDSTTTNDIEVANTGSTTRTNTNSGSDSSESKTATDQTTTVTENRSREEANKQYAYEVKALLESVDTIKAFRLWENQFAWVCGII